MAKFKVNDAVRRIGDKAKATLYVVTVFDVGDGGRTEAQYNLAQNKGGAAITSEWEHNLERASRFPFAFFPHLFGFPWEKSASSAARSTASDYYRPVWGAREDEGHQPRIEI